MTDTKKSETPDWKIFLGYSGILLSAGLGILSGLTFMFHWVQTIVYGAPLGMREDVSSHMVFTYIFVYLMNLFPVAMLALALYLFTRMCGGKIPSMRRCPRSFSMPVMHVVIMSLLCIALAMVYVMVNIAAHVRGLLWASNLTPESLAFLPLILNVFAGDRVLVLTAPFLLFLFCLYVFCRQCQDILRRRKPVPYLYMFVMSFMVVLSFLGYLYLQGVLFPDMGQRNAARVQVTTYIPASGKAIKRHTGYLVGQNAVFLSLFSSPDAALNVGAQHTDRRTLFIVAQHTVANVIYTGDSMPEHRLIGKRLASETGLDVLHMPARIVLGKLHVSVWLWSALIYGILGMAWQVRASMEPHKNTSSGTGPDEDDAQI